MFAQLTLSQRKGLKKYKMGKYSKYFLLITLLMPQFFFVMGVLAQEVNKSDSADWAVLNQAAIWFNKMGKQDSALLFARVGVEKAKTVFGENRADYAISLNNLAFLYENMGNDAAAEPLYKKVLDIRKKLLDVNSPEYASTLNSLGNIYTRADKYAAAEPLYIEALQIRKKVFGESKPAYATSLNNLAFLYNSMGKYAAAEPLYIESLAILKKLMGENNSYYASGLDNLAELYANMGNYAAAEPLYKEALKIHKTVSGENNADYASSLNNLGNLYNRMGNYIAAEPLYKKALDIRKKVLGENNPSYSSNLDNLAMLYENMGNYAAAEPLYKAAIAIYKRYSGENNPDYANSINFLGNLYNKMGNYADAETLYKQVLTIRKTVLGELHPDYSISLNNLASLYTGMGNYSAAEPLYIESIAILKKVLDEFHPEYAAVLDNLAVLYWKMGKDTAAEVLYKEALNIRKKILGETNPDYALSLNNLATLYISMENYTAAEPLYKEGIAITKKALGENHPQYATSLTNLAYLYYADNQFTKWLNLVQLVVRTENKNQQILLQNFSEAEKETFLLQNDNNWRLLLSMLHYFKSRETNVFYETTNAKNGWLLQGKQQLTNLAAGSKDPSVKTLFEQWKNTNRVYAQAIQITEEKRKQNNMNLDSLQKLTQELEKRLIAELPSFQGILNNKGLSGKEVTAKLKDKEAVIQWVTFTYRPPKKWADSVLYAAFIIRPKDTLPKFITVFEEKQVSALLKQYHSSEGRGVPLVNTRQAAKQNIDSALYQLIWKPLVPYLQNITMLYNLPSGLLHKISFAALTDSTGKQLIDAYDIHQLLSIKELHNPIPVPGSAKTIAFFGGANYDAAEEVTHAATTALTPTYRNATNNKNIHFNYLPGTKKEIETVVASAENTPWKIQTYMSTAASEDNFKQLSGENAPKILHIATHGFYFPPSKTNPTNFTFEEKNTPKDFPLLRSGLVLSGVNKYWGKDTLLENKEDGIVTAQEISNLNLLNTDLVVLSACQTALGDISGSEGVYGLQRAFKMAGAKKLLMSLWEVPDKETAELMQVFYTNVFKGDEYYTAFRKAQLTLKAKYKDPTKWAGFVLMGE